MAGTDPTPFTLRRAVWLWCAAAALMLVTAAMMLFHGFPQGADAAFREPFLRSMRFVAAVNILAGLLLASVGAFVARGTAAARRLAAGTAAIALFVNGAAFALKVGSWASLVIVVLLAVGIWSAYRAAANRFVDIRVR